jgi:hypothetical protein
MMAPRIPARDLPMEPMSYVLITGDYHPPLAGYLLLALASTLIAAQATGAVGGRRWMNHALLAATVPLALISDAWVFPLLFILVGGWFAYRLVSLEQGFLIPALAGLAVATVLEYPYLIEFTQQAIMGNAAMGLTQPEDRTPWLGWSSARWRFFSSSSGLSSSPRPSSSTITTCTGGYGAGSTRRSSGGAGSMPGSS